MTLLNKNGTGIDHLLVAISLFFDISLFRRSAQHWATSSEQARAAPRSHRPLMEPNKHD